MTTKLVLEGVTLYATDVERSTTFYRDVMGLPLLGRDDHAVHFDAGSVRLSLHPSEAPGEGGTPGFLAFGVEGDLQAAYDALRQRGATFEWPPTDRPYGRAAKFRDPDGHELYLWAPTGAATEFGPSVARYERVAALLRQAPRNP